MLDDIKKTLWATADKLRANMDAAEYKHLVLGLIFVKYVSDTFAARRSELTRRFADAADDYFLHAADAALLAAELEDRDYYTEVNVFWVPESARWEALRADFILANPPFNISDWWHSSLTGDPRWAYGDPPAGNANYAWLQHMLYHLKPTGRAGIVLANGSMSSSQNSEGEIRRAMVEADVVEAMIALPGQLFFNTQIPACLWFLARGKRVRPGEVLFIDARKLGRMISRVQSEFTDEVIARLAGTVAAWSGQLGAGEYRDTAGYCRSVKLAEIAEHGHVLTPGRYVGAEAVEDGDEAFADKMQALTEKLGEQMAKGAELDQLIRQRLGGWGMSFWQRASLDSICSTIADCPHSTPFWTDSGFLVIRNQNIKNGKLALSERSYTDHKHYLIRIRRAKPQFGDLIFTREAPMGDVCMVPEGLECCVGQRQALLRQNPELEKAA